MVCVGPQDLALHDINKYLCTILSQFKTVLVLGVIGEMADYLHSLRSNENLQKEFLILLKQPGRNLAKLSDEVGTALHCGAKKRKEGM